MTRTTAPPPEVDLASVIRARVDIKKGEVITDSMLEDSTGSLRNLPQGSINQSRDAIGKKAARDVPAGRIVKTLDLE